MQIIDILWITLTCFGVYLIGSLPFSVWVGLLAKGIDLREYNTGNPGAINSIKTFGFSLGLLTLLLDIFKGSLVIFLIEIIYSLPYFVSSDGSNLAYTLMCITGPFLAILGHNYSIWLKFEGGQGMGVFMGVLLYMNPLVFFACSIGLLIPAGLFKKSGRLSAGIGVLISIPAGLFLPIGPPWSSIHLDLLLGINDFLHLTQGLVIAVMILSLFSSIVKNTYTKSKRGTTNWFSGRN